MRRSVGESGDEGGGGGRGGGGGARSEGGGGDGLVGHRERRWQTGIGGRRRRGGDVRGVGVEGVGGGMAGGVLAAIAGRRPRPQRRRQRWPPAASGAGRHLEMGLGPANEQEGQNVRAWRLGTNMPGLGMRSVGCGCEMQVAKGAGGWLYLQRALEVVDLPPSVREELHDGVDGSTPPSRHVGSNHDPCRSMNRQGGFAGGCESRRSAEILRRKRGGMRGEQRVERDVRGAAGCAWAEPSAKLAERVDSATNLRGPRHNAIDLRITRMSPANELEDTPQLWRHG